MSEALGGRPLDSEPPAPLEAAPGRHTILRLAAEVLLFKGPFGVLCKHTCEIGLVLRCVLGLVFLDEIEEVGLVFSPGHCLRPEGRLGCRPDSSRLEFPPPRLCGLDTHFHQERSSGASPYGAGPGSDFGEGVPPPRDAELSPDWISHTRSSA